VEWRFRIDAGKDPILFTALVLNPPHPHTFLIATTPFSLPFPDTRTVLILRLIPDGAITAAHFIKTPYYVQIHGFWDGTSMNIVRLSPIIIYIY
jgi:hypothetical protein